MSFERHLPFLPVQIGPATANNGYDGFCYSRTRLNQFPGAILVGKVYKGSWTYHTYPYPVVLLNSTTRRQDARYKN